MVSKWILPFSLLCFFAPPVFGAQDRDNKITFVSAVGERTFEAKVRNTPESWDDSFLPENLGVESEALVYRFPRDTVFAFSVAKLDFPADVIGVDHTGHVIWILDELLGEGIRATPSAVIALVVVRSNALDGLEVKQGNLVIPKGFGIEARNLLPGPPDGTEKVREVLAKACSKNKKDPLAYLELADFQVGLGELQEADENYRRSIGMKPSARAYEGRARVAERKGDKEGAVAHLKKAVSLEGASLDAYRRLAVLVGATESSQRVLELLEETVRKRPKLVELRLIMARVLIARREFQEAKKALEPLTSQQSHSASAMRVLGDIHLRMGNKVKAAKAYKSYLEAYPSAPHAAELRAFILVHGEINP